MLRPSGPLLPFAFARGATFVALAAFGALHWMAMLEPAAAERAWYAVGAGLSRSPGCSAPPACAAPARWRPWPARAW